MSGYNHGLNQINKQKNSFWGKVIAILAVAIIIPLFVLISNTPKNEYLKDVFISTAQIQTTSIDTESSPEKYYIQLHLVNPSDLSVILNEDQSWVEVSREFYEKCTLNNTIGVLVGNFDIFKENNFGLFGKTGQTYEKSVCGIVDVFESLDAANEAYPHKTFTADAKLIKKTNTEVGNFFVISYNEREMTIQVDPAIYNRYHENDTVSCDFDGIGDFVKVVNAK